MSPVEEYINGFDPPARTLLEGLRRLSRECAPGADEQLKWGQPAYVHADGVILFVFSGHKSHANVTFTPSTKDAFAAELAGFKTGKGSVSLPYETEPPVELLGRMIAYRVREHEVDGVGWM